MTTQEAFSESQIRAFVEMPQPATTLQQGRRISVVLPSYNQAGFIARTLNSIVNQNYANLDLIVLDGGSTDGSQAVIEQYRPYIRHYESAPDGGQAAAINKGFAIADGEFLGWQNSDDLYLPGFFAAVNEAVAANPEADLIIANSYVIDEMEKILWPTRYGPFSLDYLIHVGWNMTSQSVFLHRDLVARIGPIPDYPVAFDWEWFIRAAQEARCLLVMSRYGGCYRVHAASKLSTTQAERRDAIERQILGKLGISLRPDVPLTRQRPLYRAWLKLLQSANEAVLYPKGELGRLLRPLWRHGLKASGHRLIGFRS